MNGRPLRNLLLLLVAVLLQGASTRLFAQAADSLRFLDSPMIKRTEASKRPVFDSTFSPRIATRRSAIIPGWGQVYNKQVWKVPIVYAALGTAAGIFIYNVKEYNGLKDAYVLKADTIPSNDAQIPAKYSVLSANSLKFYRDAFRRNVDLSVLAFLILWGLNVVDATVSAHLKQFDVSDDLALRIQPRFNLNGQAGIGLVLTQNTRHRTLISVK